MSDWRWSEKDITEAKRLFGYSWPDLFIDESTMQVSFYQPVDDNPKAIFWTLTNGTWIAYPVLKEYEPNCPVYAEEIEDTGLSTFPHPVSLESAQDEWYEWRDDARER